MTAKTRKRWFLAIGGVAVLAGFLFHYKMRDSYRCQVCWATKDLFQWRVGSWGTFSIPITPSWERISETYFRHDLLPPGHIHAWQFAQGSPYYFFGTTSAGCAIGPGRHVSQFSQVYESSPEFRGFISQRLGDESLTKSNVIAMVSAPRSSKPTSKQKEADALLETFFAR